MKKKLIRIANQIVTFEKKLQNGENYEETFAKMTELTESLSPEEMAEIDNYIQEKGLLTK